MIHTFFFYKQPSCDNNIKNGLKIEQLAKQPSLSPLLVARLECTFIRTLSKLSECDDLGTVVL